MSCHQNEIILEKLYEKYLEAVAKANKLKRDSFRLIWKVERAKEMLMR